MAKKLANNRQTTIAVNASMQKLPAIIYLSYNWHQSGGVGDGIGEDFHYCKVGERGCVGIKEVSSKEGIIQYYRVCMLYEDGTISEMKIFNPCLSEERLPASDDKGIQYLQLEVLE